MWMFRHALNLCSLLSVWNDPFFCSTDRRRWNVTRIASLICDLCSTYVSSIDVIVFDLEICCPDVLSCVACNVTIMGNDSLGSNCGLTQGTAYDLSTWDMTSLSTKSITVAGRTRNARWSSLYWKVPGAGRNALEHCAHFNRKGLQQDPADLPCKARWLYFLFSQSDLCRALLRVSLIVYGLCSWQSLL